MEALAQEVDEAETAEDAALVLLEHLFNALAATGRKERRIGGGDGGSAVH